MACVFSLLGDDIENLTIRQAGLTSKSLLEAS